MDALRDKVLADPGVHDWVKNQFLASLDRDPADALNDAKLLAAMLQERLDVIIHRAKIDKPMAPGTPPCLEWPCSIHMGGHNVTSDH